ncbi:cyclic nucleotide-binding domain-containing protein [Skermania sp. ID1734]|uniref:patatin-like phospholipase family protein n=1 Tax=Skermania sp. ID1734 TaxID=2597516 RepID=UPI00117CB181|nr:patatin-like phospholipase family protein [Skermania sp. ID1734]TSD95319.1 cyclic nucleotide-binding domain-containing protein [Skermania sp. ID1734]
MSDATNTTGIESTAELVKILARSPELAALGETGIAQLCERGSLDELTSGAILYREGDPTTTMYFLVRGRLRVTAEGAVIGYLDRLDPVGATDLLTGGPRTATVQALRDSVVLGIDAPSYLELMDAHPIGHRAFLRRAITQLPLAVKRGRQSRSNNAHGTFAVIPSSGDVPVRVLAETMVHRLSGWPAARLITAEHVDAALGEGTARAPLSDVEASARINDWLDDLDRRHDYLVFAADSGRDAWATRCLHNADRVLVLAEAIANPMPIPALSELQANGMAAPVELVLLRPEGDPSPQTMAWREITGARAHYFVHPWAPSELDSLARQVTSRGVTLVLGGGGARGFAHIGLIRAMEEMNIPIDVTGGTSMGAFIAALSACGFNSMDMAEICRETFVRANYLNDYSLPRTSLIKGERFAARLHSIFGDRMIEELRRTYFCIGTNLTTGQALVCDRGLLYRWIAVSMCVPGVAPPVAYEGELLCDGGVVDNLPIDVMRRLERGVVVACNVSTDGALRAPGAGIGEPDLQALVNWKGATKTPSLAEILVRTAMLTSSVAVEESAINADAYIRMPVDDFGMFDWKRLDDLIALGYDHASAQLSAIKETLL